MKSGSAVVGVGPGRGAVWGLAVLVAGAAAARAVEPYPELLFNGDFEFGKMGFVTAYSYKPGYLWAEGSYTLDTNPQSNHPYGWPSYTDHTSGQGEMFIANGAIVANTTVWEQMIDVAPHRHYDISTWVSTCVLPPPKFEFLINGQSVGFETAPASNGDWAEFFTTWNSGDQTVATLRIVERTLAGFGADFAIDDISLRVSATPGDANLDGFVDDADLSILMSHWAQRGAWEDGEFSGDGFVINSDLSLLLTHWTNGASPPGAPAPMSVPAPGAMVPLAVGAIGLLKRRRRA